MMKKYLDKFIAFVGKFFSRKLLVVGATMLGALKMTGAIPLDSPWFLWAGAILAGLAAFGIVPMVYLKAQGEIDKKAIK